MRVIFAQGNPGNDYALSRHNIGWRFIDAYAASQAVNFTNKPKFQAEMAEYSTKGEKTLLVKPTTFYNQTGQSLRSIIDFYKLSDRDCLIVHDDLALPIGTVRTRYGGSSAGNNGIKSINAHVGQDTARLRIGIFQPDSAGNALSNVLGKFSAPQLELLDKLEPEIFQIMDDFAQNKFEVTTVKLPDPA